MAKCKLVRCHVRFDFKIFQQTTQYFILMDRFGDNKKFFKTLLTRKTYETLHENSPLNEKI